MKIQLQYFAILKEQANKDSEFRNFSGTTALELYKEVKKEYSFVMDSSSLRVAINDSFADWETPLQEEDRVVFIPPVSGG